ncbi:hypothetical protein BG006_000146 [Podila minutissima]|uniref:Chromatin target of PRMT1 protein C-terminal domain-containing protein n=1 Tax=Podila minutissima TaxID=64525 RepID=A0A9P5SBS4_9FUNG|nr:hypothetical protein BG006_000146 [Podila minutissima]
MPQFMSIEDELADEERVLRAEQEWFLSTQVQPSLEAIQKALIVCQDAVRLQDDTKGALTLAISSTNNDILKGFVTLSSSFIVKGELVVKLPKQPVIKAAIHSQAPITNVVPSSLTVPSMTTATGTGSAAGSFAGSSGNSTDITENSEEAKDASALAQQKNSQDSQLQASPSESSSTATVAIVAPIGSHVNPHQLMHRPPGHLTQPYLLEQLKDVQNHTSQALLRLEDYWETGVVGSNQPPKDIKESTRPLKTLLELLQRHLRAGIEAMAQPNKEKLYPFRVCDPKIFSPALSEDFVIEFYIRDSQLVCAAYALQLTGGSGSGSNGGNSGPSLSTFLQQAPSQPPSAPTSAESATSHNHNSSTDANQASTGLHVHFPQQPAQAAHGQAPSSSLQPSTAVTAGDHHQPAPKGGQITHRPTSPAALHSHHQYQPLQPIQSKPYPWSPSRSPPTPQQPGEYHPSNTASVSVVLPVSSKVGQTGKGGIKGKVATTLEDKMVQVQSSKLSEISAKLSAAEGLCHSMHIHQYPTHHNNTADSDVLMQSSTPTPPGRRRGDRPPRFDWKLLPPGHFELARKVLSDVPLFLYTVMPRYWSASGFYHWLRTYNYLTLTRASFTPESFFAAWTSALLILSNFPPYGTHPVDIARAYYLEMNSRGGGITIVHQPTSLESRPGRSLGLGQGTGSHPTGNGQRIATGGGGRSRVSGGVQGSAAGGLHTAAGLARAMQERGGGVSDEFLFAPAAFVAGSGRGPSARGGRNARGGGALRGAGGARQQQQQGQPNNRAANHKALALGQRPGRKQAAQVPQTQHQQPQGIRGRTGRGASNGAQAQAQAQGRKGKGAQTAKSNGPGGKQNKKGKAKVNAGSLDSELNEYMMKDHQSAASALDNDLDSYMAEKPEESTW